jgi:superfamily II DNA or RNA helicase
MSIRDYQGLSGALGAVRDAWAGGCGRQLIAMATGLGKTVTFANLPLVGFRRILIVAHREELLDQAAEKLRHWNPGLRVDVDQAERRAEIGGLFQDEAYAVCASVATIGRKGSPRLERYPRDYFDAVVIDEAHHASAQSYQTLIEWFRAGELCGPLLLGVTATPFRADGQDLSKVFDKIVFSYDLPTAIDRGHLVDLKAFSVATNTSLDEVQATREDFKAGQLEDAVNTPGRNTRIVKAYLERAADRKAVVFAAGVEHSKALTAGFQEVGIAAEHVDGTTPGDERAAILRRLRTGETNVVSNCAVLTEGFDEPSLSAVILARPTKSGVLYQQMVGRITRLFPGKTDALVIDVADVSSRHSLVSAAALFGLPTGLDLQGKSASAARKKVKELVQEGLPFEELQKAKSLLDLDLIANQYRSITLFWKPKPAEALTGVSRNVWIPCGQDAYSLRAGELLAVVRIDLLGKARVTITQRAPKVDLGFRMPDVLLSDITDEHASLADAIQYADAEMAKRSPRVFLDPTAKWRRDPASEKQLAILRKKKVPFREPITKGEAGILLDKLFAKRQQMAGGAR